jgi:hypothetical protein
MLILISFYSFIAQSSTKLHSRDYLLVSYSQHCHCFEVIIQNMDVFNKILQELFFYKNVSLYCLMYLKYSAACKISNNIINVILNIFRWDEIL